MIGNCDSCGKEIQNKEQIRYILKAIHHYWLKGYIQNQQLFNFIETLVLYEKDPFQIVRYLRQIALNCIFQTNALQNKTTTNGYVRGYTIDSIKFDSLWISEYNRLQNAIGKSKPDRCGGCGKSILSVIKIITEADLPREHFDYYREYIGRVCWVRKCTCRWNDQEIIEINHNEDAKKEEMI